MRISIDLEFQMISSNLLHNRSVGVELGVEIRRSISTPPSTFTPFLAVLLACPSKQISRLNQRACNNNELDTPSRVKYAK